MLIEDDSALRPEIDEQVALYVAGLNEGHGPYERYFDALLIKRASHRAFFNDLRSFRQIPLSIATLQRAGTDKSAYREVTVQYLGSTYAHPWCRKTPLKKGFWRSEWGTIDGKKKDNEIAREEDRLHKSLVPIWVIMRLRMFPGQEVVQKWINSESQRRQNLGLQPLTATALHADDARTEREYNQTLQDENPDGQAKDEDEDSEDGQATAAHAATSVFRLAAAGAILSQTPKRKLRWLTKKPR